MKAITPRQREVLNFIADRITQTTTPPSLGEICLHFGLADAHAVREDLMALEKLGRLDLAHGEVQSLRPRNALASGKRLVQDIPIFGTVPAGPPEERLDEVEGCLSADLSALEIEATDRTFALQVRDDSLEAIHVCRGDLVLFEHGREPTQGDLVAVLCGGQSAIRVYGLERRGPVLILPGAKPEKALMNGALLQGVMIALIREC